jgi:hypothetical protein
MFIWYGIVVSVNKGISEYKGPLTKSVVEILVTRNSIIGLDDHGLLPCFLPSVLQRSQTFTGPHDNRSRRAQLASILIDQLQGHSLKLLVDP